MKFSPYLAGGLALALILAFAPPALPQEGVCYSLPKTVIQLRYEGIQYAVTDDPVVVEALRGIAELASGQEVRPASRAILAVIEGVMFVGFERDGCLALPIELGIAEDESHVVDPSLFGPLYSPFAEHQA